MSDPTTALPSVTARVVAFVAILFGGLLGGAIGYWFMDLQCEQTCTVPSGFAMLAGTVSMSVGVAIIAVISLRVAAEWSSPQT